MNDLQIVTAVKPINDFILEITFKDGKSFRLDFKDWVKSNSGWLFEPIKTPEGFSKVFVHAGAIEWAHGLDICSDGLRLWCEYGHILPESETAEILSNALAQQSG